MCTRFHRDFPPHEKETEWKFISCSTMKMTTIEMPPGAINQIPAKCTIQGDIRLTPFYTVEKAKAAVEAYVSDITANITSLPTRGPGFTYDLGEKKAQIKRAVWISHHHEVKRSCRWKDPLHQGGQEPCFQSEPRPVRGSPHRPARRRTKSKDLWFQKRPARFTR